MRGYMFTIVSYVLLISLFTMAMNYHRISEDERWDVVDVKSIEKLAALADDVATDLMSIHSVEAGVANSSAGTIVSVKQGLRVPDYGVALTNYRDYLSGGYQTLASTNISLQTSNSLSVFPQGITIEYQDASNTRFTSYGNATGYTVLVQTGRMRDGASMGGSGSGFPLVIVVEDAVGSMTYTNDDSPGNCNTYWVNFTDGSRIDFSMGDCAGPNSLMISPNAAFTDVSVNITAAHNGATQLRYGGELTLWERAAGVNVTTYPTLAR